ncbi:uncharacterized protein LOC143268062 [Peromyscus maniculatus bairdii]|uniref:uncharacterized protein LOC143268062 n=1 Tax=Peromyscus maniculatus bairdii TaxID=230844 RepID=UPI003FD46238
MSWAWCTVPPATVQERPRTPQHAALRCHQTRGRLRRLRGRCTSASLQRPRPLPRGRSDGRGLGGDCHVTAATAVSSAQSPEPAGGAEAAFAAGRAEAAFAGGSAEERLRQSHSSLRRCKNGLKRLEAWAQLARLHRRTYAPGACLASQGRGRSLWIAPELLREVGPGHVWSYFVIVRKGLAASLRRCGVCRSTPSPPGLNLIHSHVLIT